MYFYSRLDAGVSCLLGTRGSHRSSTHRVSAHGCRGTWPAYPFQAMVVWFSLHVTSHHHSFALAIRPTHQPVSSITLPSLASAQHLRLRSWDKTVSCDKGGGTATHLSAALGGFHPNRGANSSAQPPSCSLGLRFLVAMREGGGRGPGSDNGPQQSRSTGPVWGSSCPSTPLPKHLPQADRGAWPSAVFCPRRRKVLFVSLGWALGRGLSPCPPGPHTPAPACKEFSVPGRSFYKASPFFSHL